LAFPYFPLSLFAFLPIIVLLPSTFRPSTPPPSFFDFVILSCACGPSQFFAFLIPAIPRLD
jgi:hypothetical protein